MTRSTTLTSLLLSIGLLSGMAQSAEMVPADLANGLNSVGTISIQGIKGSPQDVELAIARKADEQGASYYRILHMRESYTQNSWGATAEIYR